MERRIVTGVVAGLIAAVAFALPLPLIGLRDLFAALLELPRGPGSGLLDPVDGLFVAAIGLARALPVALPVALPRGAVALARHLCCRRFVLAAGLLRALVAALLEALVALLGLRRALLALLLDALAALFGLLRPLLLALGVGLLDPLAADLHGVALFAFLARRRGGGQRRGGYRGGKGGEAPLQNRTC